MYRKERGSVEEKTLSYLKTRPEIFYAYQEGLLNLNGLANKIASEYGDLKALSVRAVLQKVLRDQKVVDQRKRTNDLLRKSKITLQDKVSVITAKRKLDIEFLSVTFLTDSVVYIVDESRVKGIPKDVEVERNVSLIHIFSPKEIETTPGFVLNVVQRINAAGINILQLISCSNETMMVVDKSDAISAYSALVQS